MQFITSYSDFKASANTVNERYIKPEPNTIYVFSEQPVKEDASDILEVLNQQNKEYIGRYEHVQLKIGEKEVKTRYGSGTQPIINYVVFNSDAGSFTAHSDYNYMYKVILTTDKVVNITPEEAAKYLPEFFEHNKEIAEKAKDADGNLPTKLDRYKDSDTIKEFANYLLEKFNALVFTTFSFLSDSSKTYYLPVNLIKGLQLLDRKDNYDSHPEYDKENKVEISDWDLDILRKFMSKSGGTINPKDYRHFETLVPTEPLKVYRGMSWNPENLFRLKEFSSYPFHLNDTITITNKKVNSTTTNLLVAEDFAVHSPLWIVLEMTIEPKDVVADTRKLVDDQLETLYRAKQKEIIIKPGKYKSKIIKIGTGNGISTELKDDLTTGFDGYDIKEYIKLKDEFQKAYKHIAPKLEKEGFKVSFETNNKHIFSDYAVEVPLIKVYQNSYRGKYQGVVEPRFDIDTQKFLLYIARFADYKKISSAGSKKEFETSTDMINFYHTEEFYDIIFQTIANGVSANN